MSSNVSSCYKVIYEQISIGISALRVLQVDQSWANSTLLDVLTSVPDYEECQILCRVILSKKDDIYNPPLSYPGQGWVWGLDLDWRGQRCVQQQLLDVFKTWRPISLLSSLRQVGINFDILKSCRIMCLVNWCRDVILVLVVKILVALKVNIWISSSAVPRAVCAAKLSSARSLRTTSWISFPTSLR